MGGNGTPARKGTQYKKVASIAGVAVVEGTGRQHNLPFHSPDGKPRIKLHPDGTLQQMQIYGEDGRPKLDLDYKSEPSLEQTPSQKPIFHYHEWSATGLRSKPKPATQDLL
ncbi:MAG: hypothetical protein J6Y27_02240 [Bacteroidales bacterium]|nr:hypothetical protein [Bacteroidales bacterium]